MQRIPQYRVSSVLLIAALSASLLLAGCTSLPGQQQDVAAKTYLLQAPENDVEISASKTASCLTLVVNRMRAAPGFATARIAYVQKDYQLDYFAHHQWAETPANMLTTVVTHELKGSHLFSAVVESPAAITTNFRLDSELLHLQQVFKNDGSSVQLQVRFMLIDQESRGVVASHTFSVSEAAPENTPYGGVVAANRAVARLLPELIEFTGKASHDLALSCQPGLKSGK